LAYQLEDDQRAYESALNERDAQIRRMREECQALMLELQMLLVGDRLINFFFAKNMANSHRTPSKHWTRKLPFTGECWRAKRTAPDSANLWNKSSEHTKYNNPMRLVRKKGTCKSQSESHSALIAESTRVLRGEKSSRQSYQRSAKGNVSILEASPDGKYIVLENTHRSKEEAIGEWKLKRRIDGKREILFTFPRDFILRPGKTVKIWARNQGGIQMPPEQLIFEGEESFGVGSNVQTMLYNREGEVCLPNLTIN
jgi:intermediate filament protein if